MKHLSFILLVIIFSSCYTQRAAIRDLNKIKVHHPDLIEEITDTIFEVYEVIKEVPIAGDTLKGNWGWDWSKVDTFYQTINDSIFITEVRLIRDTVIDVSIRTEVFPDTIEVIHLDTIDKIVTRVEYVTKVENKIPLGHRLLMGAIAIALLLLIFFYTVKERNPK